MKKTYIHTLTIRIWHWINAFIVIVLIITGIQLRTPSVRIFESYKDVVQIHKYFGYAMIVSFFFWLFYCLFSSNLKKHYILRIDDLRSIPKQLLYYTYYIFKGGENPHTPTKDNKFNPLQKMAYTFIMLIATPIIGFTGILFTDILYFFTWIKALGGLRFIDAVHVIFAYIFAFYFLIHLYMSTIGKTFYSHIKSMITGYEE
ncbi:MAG: cytochrome b/b6 domain-containing protein [Syntrophorhabdaceae bacterium]|nr:cytochrome b/b6 domain-containing protein [Syntrophorhabdaceae bacterium]